TRERHAIWIRPCPVGSGVRFRRGLHVETGRRGHQIQESGDAMKARRLFAACVLAACAAAAGEWPQFRGPASSGVSDDARPPVKWDAVKGTNIVWTADIPGLSVSSPVV